MTDLDSSRCGLSSVCPAGPCLGLQFREPNDAGSLSLFAGSHWHGWPHSRGLLPQDSRSSSGSELRCFRVLLVLLGLDLGMCPGDGLLLTKTETER